MHIRDFGPKSVPTNLWGALGAGLALSVMAGVFWALGLGALIAPFGASAVLVFMVGQGAMSRPWNVVVGNTVSALVATALVWALSNLGPDLGAWLVPLFVAAAILAMIALRALHPPGGAVAMVVALRHHSDLGIALHVALGSLVLVACAMVWGAITRRPYPA